MSALSPLCAALLSVSRDALDQPAALLEVVRAHASPVAQGRRAARAILTQAVGLVEDPLTDGQPPDWQWNLGANLDLLQRLADDERIALIAALYVIRVNVIAHQWHIDHTGVDRLVEIRWRFVDLLGGLIVSTRPRSWEGRLLDRPRGPVLHVTAGLRIRRRRTAAGLTQAQLAAAVGVAQATVVRWEAGERRASTPHAQALTRVLGGEARDYVGE